MAKRGCGYREAGGVYVECMFGPNGQPVEFFCVDPPVRTDPATVPKRGVKMVRGDDGALHLMDWIGVEHYPTVAHFLEEVRSQGLSRRIRKNFDFSLLDERSKLVCVHRDTVIENPQVVTRRHVYRCPKTLLDPDKIGFVSEEEVVRLAGKCEYPHRTGDKRFDAKMKFMYPKGIDCIGLWWRDVPVENAINSKARAGELIRVPLANGGEFSAFARYKGVKRSPGIFALFPIARVAVVETPSDPSVAQERARRISEMTRVPVTLAKE